MYPKRILLSIILTAFVFLSIFTFYIKDINFIGSLKIELKAPHNAGLNFFALTALNKKQSFFILNDSNAVLSGYYKEIIMTIEKPDLITNNDSLVLSLNEANFRFCLKDVIEQWKTFTEEGKLNIQFSESIQQSHSFISKINAFLLNTNFSVMPLLIYFFILLIIVSILLLYSIWKSKILMLWNIVEKKYIFLFSIILSILYFFVFFGALDKKDNVWLGGDTWEYQVMAVNLVKGHGVQKLSCIEPFESYKFDNENIDTESYRHFKKAASDNTDTYRTPAYSLFLGLIYFIGGINPANVSLVQLFMLCLVAGLLPLVLSKVWRMKGFLTGCISGFFFLLLYYPRANLIMTEVLLVYFCFLSVWAVITFEQTNKTKYAITVGVFFALTLLTKGMLIIAVFFYFLNLFYVRIIEKQKNLGHKPFIMLMAFLLVILPWSIYASFNNKFIYVEAFSKKQLVTATTKVDSIFEKTKIDTSNIVEMVSLINEIYYENKYWTENRCQFVKQFVEEKPHFIRSADTVLVEFAKGKMNMFFRKHIDYMMIPFFNNKYLYFNFDGFTFLTGQVKTLLLQSNNEYCTDGGWHKDKNAFDHYYYRNDNSEKGSWQRVAIFYYNNPNLIAEIFPSKIFRAYKDFFFYKLLAVLILFNGLTIIMGRFINKKKIFLLLLFAILIPLTLVAVELYSFVLIGLICMAFLLGILLYLKKRNPYLFEVPKFFNLIILNIFLISFIFYGLDRFTFIGDFIVIPTCFLFLAYFLRRFFDARVL
ncbi:MAG: glycosyltransferase family 39 protein [Bacteroidales bacterium]|nr:glycosyltransferase family 39 protein [Bacteroidales bacterium]